MTVQTDDFPGEASWEIVDQDIFPGSVVLSGGPYQDEFTEYSENGALYLGCFVFVLRDAYGDGGTLATVEYFGVSTSVFVGEFLETAQFGVCESPDSSCYETSEIPGCTDSTCSTAVCDIELSCCGGAWDFGCVLLACDNCEGSPDFCRAIEPTDFAVITLEMDPWPSETTWELVDVKLVEGNVVASGGPYVEVEPDDVVTEYVQLYNSCFEFVLYDSLGDGGATATIEYLGFQQSISSVGLQVYLRMGDCEGVDPRPTAAPTATPAMSECFDVQPIPSCTNEDCSEIVCLIDPFCCDISWDSSCVEFACLNCQGAPEEVCDVVGGTLAPTFEPVASDCSFASPLGGCTNESCQAAVCGEDAFCCETEFDGVCVNLACDLCALPDVSHCSTYDDDDGLVMQSRSSTCFELSPKPGCSDAMCQESICAIAPFCCESGWESACVGLACDVCIGGNQVCEYPNYS